MGAGEGVPDAGCLIFADRQEPCAVVVKLRAPDKIGVSGQGPDELSGVCIPELNGLIPAGGC